MYINSYVYNYKYKINLNYAISYIIKSITILWKYTNIYM